jgi:hypothetical protein
MHAVTVLQKCLSNVFNSMHATRARVLLGAVTALLASRRLILMDLARAWPGAERVRAPLKRLDRLLGNGHLAGEREGLYAAMARWLVRYDHPIIVIDWSELKTDGRFHLLRAAIPVGGRTLTVLEAVYRTQNSPRAEKQFLKRLKALLPEGVRPILVTDAGFRGPWFRQVQRLGWEYVGRVRGRTRVQLNAEGPWIDGRTLYPSARRHPQRWAGGAVVRNHPVACTLVLYRRRPQGRHVRTRNGARLHSYRSDKAARREREPWLLATSLTDCRARQIVALYKKRMQIEEGFRDLKCDRFGCAFTHSLTRYPERLAILLLIHALASFLAWLTALALDIKQAAVTVGGVVSSRTHRHYSLLRLGWEAHRYRSSLSWSSTLKHAFTHPPPWFLKELEIPG